MADKLWIDFETYSECDIKLRGGMNYAKHHSTDIVCLGYAFDDDDPSLWIPGLNVLPERLFRHVASSRPVYAHNVTFDYRIWNYVGARYGMPVLSLDQMIDTMSLALTFQIPAKLSLAGEALAITMPKDADGNRLIKLCCCPTKTGARPSSKENPEAFNKLYMYCLRDIEAMREFVQNLPRDFLIPKEQEIWELTYEMNTKGLPVDYEAISHIKAYLETYIEEAIKVIPKMSGGAFQTVNQVARIKEWMEGVHDYPMESLDAAHVLRAMADDSCPQPVKEILELRQELGRSSTAKFTKLLNQAVRIKAGYIVCDNMQYHGAGTGRWAGRGFQMHNLPRAKVKNPEEYIEAFITGNAPIENPVGVAKALIRPMILAPMNQELIVSDYSSIENRVLHWLADDHEALEDFANDIDQYITMAAARYNKSYEYIKEGRENGDQECKDMRQMGKVIILGAGFGMGADTFVDTARDQFGMAITPDDAKLAIGAYREKYYKVKELWNDLKTAAVRAVISGERQTVHLITFATATVKGRRWLAMLLPSGKCIYYLNPRVDQMHIPKFESMGKVPTITHDGQNPYTKKWGRLKLIPGRITENAVQGTAREMMAQGLLNVKKNLPGIDLLGTVHDEAIGLQYIGQYTIEAFNEQLCDISWALDCPLKAEGWTGPRYMKT